MIQTILAKNPQPWTVHSVLTQGYGNILWQTDKSACVVVSNYYFLEGPFEISLAEKLAEHIRHDAIITSSNKAWHDYLIQKNNCLKRITRRLYIWNNHPEKLAPYLSQTKYVIKNISEKEAEKMLQKEWSKDVFNSYEGIDDFLQRGFGFCITEKEKIISACLSFSHSDYGIEVEIDTDPDYQKKGLAKIVAAYFVNEALKRELKPLWDASNSASAKIAEALGFNFISEYEALWWE